MMPAARPTGLRPAPLAVMPRPAVGRADTHADGSPKAALGMGRVA